MSAVDFVVLSGLAVSVVGVVAAQRAKLRREPPSGASEDRNN
jgi:hypothetical protein